MQRMDDYFQTSSSFEQRNSHTSSPTIQSQFTSQSHLSDHSFGEVFLKENSKEKLNGSASMKSTLTNDDKFLKSLPNMEEAFFSSNTQNKRQTLRNSSQNLILSSSKARNFKIVSNLDETIGFLLEPRVTQGNQDSSHILEPSIQNQFDLHLEIPSQTEDMRGYVDLSSDESRPSESFEKLPNKMAVRDNVNHLDIDQSFNNFDSFNKNTNDKTSVFSINQKNSIGFVQTEKRKFSLEDVGFMDTSLLIKPSPTLEASSQFDDNDKEKYHNKKDFSPISEMSSEKYSKESR